LRYSPVSREVAGIAVFFSSLGAHFLVVIAQSQFIDSGGYTVLDAFYDLTAFIALKHVHFGIIGRY